MAKVFRIWRQGSGTRTRCGTGHARHESHRAMCKWRKLSGVARTDAHPLSNHLWCQQGPELDQHSVVLVWKWCGCLWSDESDDQVFVWIWNMTRLQDRDLRADCLWIVKAVAQWIWREFVDFHFQILVYCNRSELPLQELSCSVWQMLLTNSSHTFQAGSRKG